MRNRLQQFMADRYGVDALGYALLFVSIVLYLLTRFFDLPFLSLIGCILLVWTMYRVLSKDIQRRHQENQRFLGFFRRGGKSAAVRQERLRQSREYKFFLCPGCKNRLRVPRGKGKIQITCPRCGHRFCGKT